MRLANKSIVLCFVLIFLINIATAHPGWVKTGVTAYYQGIGAFKKNGEYNSGAQMNIVNTVDSATNGNIVVTTTFTEPTSGYTITNISSFGPGDALGAFWYDDKALQNMKTGDTVNVFIKDVGGNIPFTVTKGPFRDMSGKVWDAVMLEVNDTVQIRMIFDVNTGLLLHYAEIYPNQETYIDFKSISVDLSTYQTPANPNTGGQGNTGTNGTTSPNPNNLCGSLFLISAGATLAFIKK